MLDDETFLQICRETGRIHDLVDRLLELDRLGEAIERAKPASDYDWLTLADIFVKHGHGDVAERLMLERSKQVKDTRILEWLKNRALERCDKAAALEWAEKIFRMGPRLEGYKELRKLAKQLDRWETLRPELLAALKDSYLLTQIYLDEGEINQALEAVKSKRKPSLGFVYRYGYGMELEVAKAAEQTRPHAAIEIYQQCAAKFIDARGRGNYMQACELLKKVRDLYDRLDEGAAWSDYIADLRERTRSLRALKKEMAAAKL